MAANDDGAFSNQWGVYMIKAVMSENTAKARGAPWPALSQEEITRHNENIRQNTEGKVYLLPLPIVSEQITDIVEIHTDQGVIRLYPPFPVNEKAETSAAFHEIGIPTGNDKITGTQPLPQTAVTGLRSEHNVENAAWCRGLRMDAEAGVEYQTVLDILLEQIAQYTHQWWLRAIHNPFLGPLRFAGEINHDYSFTQELRHEGAGDIEATWYGACQQQSNLGIGKPLTGSIWRQCCALAVSGQRAETGIMSFLDGVAAFMAGRTNQSILHLCIAVEILANKHRMVIENKSDIKLDKLIRQTLLLDDKSREVIKNLMIDRGHVAHGRDPHCLGRKDGATMQNYIEHTRDMVNAYLQALRDAGKWQDAVNLKIG